MTYTERFTVTLQAPDFDFRMFPLDKQAVYLRIDMLYNQYQYVFVPLADQFLLGSQLGEEEFIFKSMTPSTSIADGISHFALRFDVDHNFLYYALWVVVPLAVIFLVTWVTFFIGDYVKRVDVAGANLLVFTAYNLTISNELPRLGYLTLLDTLLISVFVVTGLTLILNVYFQWLKNHDRLALAVRLDRYAIWACLLGLAILTTALFVFVVFAPS